MTGISVTGSGTEVDFTEATERTNLVSDTYLIKKIGTEEIYSEAWDLIDSSFEYEETEQPKEAENIELNV